MIDIQKYAHTDFFVLNRSRLKKRWGERGRERGEERGRKTHTHTPY